MNFDLLLVSTDDEYYAAALSADMDMPCIVMEADGEVWTCTASYLRTFDGSENIADFGLQSVEGRILPLVMKDMSTLTLTKVDQTNSCAFHVETTNASFPYLECVNDVDPNFIENGTWVADTSKGLSSCLTPAPTTNSSATLNVAPGLYEITLAVYGIHEGDDEVFSTYIDPKGNKIFCSVMEGDQDNRDRFQCRVTWLEQLDGDELISDFDLKFLDEYSTECDDRVVRSESKMYLNRLSDNACSFHLERDLDIVEGPYHTADERPHYVFENETWNRWLADSGSSSCLTTSGTELSVEPGIYSLNYRFALEVDSDYDHVFSIKPKGDFLSCYLHEGDQGDNYLMCEKHTIITLRGNEHIDDFKVLPDGIWFAEIMYGWDGTFDVKSNYTSLWMDKIANSAQTYTCASDGTFTGTSLTCTRDIDGHCGSNQYPSFGLENAIPAGDVGICKTCPNSNDCPCEGASWTNVFEYITSAEYEGAAFGNNCTFAGKNESYDMMPCETIYVSDGICESAGYASVISGAMCSRRGACTATECCTGTFGGSPTPAPAPAPTPAPTSSSTDDYDVSDAVPYFVPLLVVIVVLIAILAFVLLRQGGDKTSGASVSSQELPTTRTNNM